VIKKILICLFIGTFSFLLQVKADNHEIKFTGVLSEDIKLASKKLKLPGTSTLNLGEVDEVLRFLYLTGHYEDVEAVSDSNREISIHAQPVRKIDEIEVRGNSALSKSEIIEALGFAESQKLPVLQLKDLEKKVNDAYQKAGFYKTSTNLLLSEKSPGKVKVVVSVSEGEPCIIQSVKIDTINTELLKNLNRLLKSQIGKPFAATTTEEIQTKIVDYFVEERFLSAQLGEPDVQLSLDRQTVNLRFSVENPYRYYIYYYGNEFFDTSQLSKSLKLNTPERFGLNPAAELSDRIKLVYQKQGFADVKVTFEDLVYAQNYFHKVRFQINEGPQIRIRSIQIGGRVSQAPKEYIDFIKTHSSDLIDRGYYNSEDLETGYKNLIVHLQNEGYLQAKLQSSRTEFSRDRVFARIKVFIDEGPRTHITGVNFSGVSGFSKEILYDVVKFKPGDPLKLTLVEESLQKLQDFFFLNGYLDMQIQGNTNELVRYNEGNTEATIDFDIHEGPQVKVSNIIVQGNDVTHEDVITREVDFKVGDILTSDRIKESDSRLQKLGLFSSVEIKTIEHNTSLANRTVVVTVTEGNPGSFKFGGALNNEFGNLGLSILTYTGIGYRNLAGTARAVSANAEINYHLLGNPEHDVTLGYLEPFVFNERLRGRINVSQSLKIFKEEPAGTIDLETSQIGATLEKDLSKKTRFSWKVWNLAQTRQFAYSGYSGGAFPEEKLTIATIGPTLDIDLRDNSLVPTQGVFYHVSVDYSRPEFINIPNDHQVHYYKADSNFKTYTRLGSPRWVFANSLSGGYLQNLSNQPDGRVPEEVMFFLGGRSTIRGFDQASIPSRDELTQKLGIPSNSFVYTTTDSHYYLIKSELRFPISGEFGGVLFYDGGAVKISGITLNDEYRDAAGFGFRYNTPVGPVSAEIAWKLDRKDIPAVAIPESVASFYFSIGAF